MAGSIKRGEIYCLDLAAKSTSSSMLSPIVLQSSSGEQYFALIDEDEADVGGEGEAVVGVSGVPPGGHTVAM